MKLLPFFILAWLILLSGCQQSSDVVSNSFLQKRKYRAGFHLNQLKNQKASQNHTDSLLYTNSSQPIFQEYFEQSEYTPHLISSDSTSQMKGQKTLSDNRKRLLRLKALIISKHKSNTQNNSPSDELEPVDEEQIEKSKKRLKISSITSAIASIPLLVFTGITLLGIAAALPEILLSFLFLFLMISIPVLLVAGTIALVYAIERLLNQSNRSLFRTKFRNFAAIASIVIGIAAMLFLVLSGGFMGLLMYLVLINLFNELAWLIPLFGIFVSGIVIAGIYALLAWLNTIFISISFKEFKKSLFSIIGHVIGWIAGIVAGFVVFIALLTFVV